MKQNKHHNARADDVGYYGGDRHTCHTEVKYDDQNQVQNRIDNARCDQTVQRSLAVPDAAQDRRAEIIQHDKRHPQQINPQIQHCKVDHILRRPHQK